ncbi:MAG: hypothetical protein ACLVL2_02210 [Bacteroides cellulosilyticus]
MHHELGSTDDISQLKIYEIGSYTRTLEGWQKMIASIKEGEKHQSFMVYNPLPRFPEILAYEGNAYWVTSDEGVGTILGFRPGHFTTHPPRTTDQVVQPDIGQNHGASARRNCCERYQEQL